MSKVYMKCHCGTVYSTTKEVLSLDTVQGFSCSPKCIQERKNFGRMGAELYFPANATQSDIDKVLMKLI